MSRPSPAGLEGAERVCRTLEALGVTHAFGLPGTQTVPLYEALRRSSLESVVPSSELSAAFMAGAHFRAAGRVAALVTIPGPGFTWALTGLAEARADSAALLHLTLAEPEGARARFELQAIPQRTVGEALAKGYFTVRHLDEVEPVLRQAHALALEGEPGPVIVALAEGKTTGGASAAGDERASGSAHASAERPDGDLAPGWDRLRRARRPLLYVGQGGLGAAPAIRRLAEALGAPVMTTPSGRGVLPETHPLAMPFDPCRGGLDVAVGLMRQADLVLVLGARLGHNGSAGRALPFDSETAFQVDAAPENCGAAFGLPGSVARVEAWIDAEPSDPLPRSLWTEAELEEAHRALRSPGPARPEPRIAGRDPAEFFAQLRHALPPSGRLVTDTGLHQILTRRHLDVLRPGGLLFPSDLQSMGFGLPAAIGVRLATPSEPVVALVGDGSLAMNALDLATAARLGLNLPVIVFADGFLNQIRVQQQGEIGHESGVSLPPVDLEALAEAVGVHFAWVDDIARELPLALNRDRPTLLAVPVGDSSAMRRVARGRKARNLVKQALGRRLLNRLRRS